MIDQKKRMYQSETLSLLSLKLILTEAKKESPPQTRKEQNDANEELARKLIAGMKKNYKRFVFNPPSWKADLSSNNSIKKVNVLEP